MSDLVKKKDYGAKHQISNLNILQLLIVINLRMNYLTQRLKKKKKLMNLIFIWFKNNSDLDKKIKRFVTKAEFKAYQEKTMKLQTCDSGFFLLVKVTFLMDHKIS